MDERAQDIAWRQAQFDKAWKKFRDAEENLLVAVILALEAGEEQILAHQSLHKATGKYNAKQLRELEEDWLQLSRRRHKARGIVRSILEPSKMKRVLGIGF
ncbi:MAG TPA: hypothetical protein VFB13_17545 [Reyranella sp.]|jgi:hypothetical protein|nr:hypothetical protein [Chloroflexota bacterium]HZQ01354.1 hypothetical protein [Reyranella sp.]